MSPQKQITLEDLENNADGHITPEMIFGTSEEPQEKTISVNPLDLKALLDEKPVSQTTDKSPVDLFLEEIGVGVAFDDYMYEAGLKLLNDGLSVIPVGKDKRPFIIWKDFQERRATPDELLSWFTRFKDMQLGVVTGKISNIIVVDVDKPDLDVSWLPNTASVKTGSGGMHYYFAYTPGFTNKARIKEFIDIRADGGYVIVPPSCNLKGKYEWVNKVPPAPFPIALFREPEQPQARPVEFVKTEYIGFGEGQRNAEMAKYIGHILSRVHPQEWQSLAYPVIQTANAKNNPPLPEFELNNIFQSICGREKQNNQERWYQQQLVKRELIASTEKVPVNILVKKEYRPRYTWGTPGLDENLAIIKRGNFIVVGAKQSQGKTTYTFDMACKNASLGHKVLYLSLEMEEALLRDDISRKYAGITIPEEYNYNIPEEKQAAYNQKQNEIQSITNLYFRSLRRGDSPKWETIIKTINEYNELDLIFIDNLDLIDGDVGEENTERQKRITKRIMNFTAEYKIPLILIHHHRKSMGKDYGADELTGSGKIKDNADIILKIERTVDPEAVYPKNCQSWIKQQKGRGYPEATRTVFFIDGTFVDRAPNSEGLDDGFTPKKIIYGIDD